MHALESARLTPALAARMEAGLRGAHDGELTAFLWKLRRRLASAPPSPAALRQARELELVEPGPAAPLALTPLGAKVSDSLTEYGYWKERGKRHHFSEEIPALRVENLRGRRILELGCGAGVNLLSLQRCAEVVGVDVEPLYLRFGEVLAHLENVPAPTRVCALAERLPFEDASFDVALFPGSLPYMQIQAALHETARVLRPGGRVIAVHSDLGQARALHARQRRERGLGLGSRLRHARALIGTLLYPWLGRALLAPFAPIHAPDLQMRRWLRSAGLRMNEYESRRTEHEICYVADKRDPLAAEA
jgi:SAM-dependent methyltransferase